MRDGRAEAMIALARAAPRRVPGVEEETMAGTAAGTREYRVDGDGFLTDFDDWDESFAESMAPKFGIAGGLTPRHWEVIHYIRRMFVEYGQCPLVYHTCKANGLRIRDLQTLFPSGYLRGACRLAGVTYKHGYHGSGSLPAAAARPAAARQGEAELAAAATTYTIDVHGFLVDPSQDEAYARNRAAEMKLPKLTDAHWRVLRFLRERHAASGVVPTIYETCAGNGLELEDLERLFPDGYQRGAVKLAGLRVI
jgi:tRNA 2-thiouridine synthesizing protein E